MAEVSYDETQASFEIWAKFFFEVHDPTQENGQGPDIGPQYRSVIFYQDESEKVIVDGLIEELESLGYDIVTQIETKQTFWPAELYHQSYYEKTGKVPYCHSYQKKFLN